MRSARNSPSRSGLMIRPARPAVARRTRKSRRGAGALDVPPMLISLSRLERQSKIPAECRDGLGPLDRAISRYADASEASFPRVVVNAAFLSCQCGFSSLVSRGGTDSARTEVRGSPGSGIRVLEHAPQELVCDLVMEHDFLALDEVAQLLRAAIGGGVRKQPSTPGLGNPRGDREVPEGRKNRGDDASPPHRGSPVPPELPVSNAPPLSDDPPRHTRTPLREVKSALRRILKTPKAMRTGIRWRLRKLKIHPCGFEIAPPSSPVSGRPRPTGRNTRGGPSLTLDPPAIHDPSTWMLGYSITNVADASTLIVPPHQVRSFVEPKSRSTSKVPPHMSILTLVCVPPPR
ncbi:MAG: hypothetical protein FLDDKLPJ_00660 [Phycisphaerae bacterium]|nr:hypothetical protein [Phycisphaerae bacterium]